MLQTYRMLIEYDGTPYIGWQIQNEGTSVQGVLQHALAQVTGATVPVVAAGRTDAGVHALGQVVSFQVGTRLAPEVLVRAVNANLPRSIRIRALEPCEQDFHARYGASGKRYVYLIQNEPRTSVFAMSRVWVVSASLDLGAINSALQSLVGRHDFSSFRAAGCSARNPVRNLVAVTVEQVTSCALLGIPLEARIIRVTVEADAFLRHMVRNIVGFAVEVGRGRIPASEAPALLERADRTRNPSPTAPASGLYLAEVIYPHPVFTKTP